MVYCFCENKIIFQTIKYSLFLCVEKKKDIGVQKQQTYMLVFTSKINDLCVQEKVMVNTET